MRVKFIQDHKNHRSGDVVEVTRNEAFGLIDSGYAVVSKDITQRETKKKIVTNGNNNTQLRTN